MDGEALSRKALRAVLTFALMVLAVVGASAAGTIAAAPTAAYADSASGENQGSKPYHGEAYTMDYLNQIIQTEDNAAITVCDNLTGNIVVPEGKSITIDLNGYTITTSGGVASIRNQGSLTITDSTKAQNGKIASSAPVLAAAPGSTTTFKAGTFSSAYGQNSDLIIEDPDAQSSTAKASVSIEGGMWDGSFSATGSADITIGLGTNLSTNALVYGARFFPKDAVVKTTDAATFTLVNLEDVRQKVYGKYYKQVQVHYYLSDAWTTLFFMGETREQAEDLYRLYYDKGDDRDGYQEIGSLTFEFDSNGGSAVEDMTIDADGKGMARVESADMLPTPVRDGYTFTGWEQVVSTAGDSEEWAALTFPYSRNVGESMVVCKLRACWVQDVPQQNPKAEDGDIPENADKAPAAQEAKSPLAKTSDSIPVLAVAAVAVVAVVAVAVAIVAARRRRG